MTRTMREIAEENIKTSNGNLTIEFAKENLEHAKKVLSYWEYLSYSCSADYGISKAKSDIEYYEAVITILTEIAEAEAADKAAQIVMTPATVTSKINPIRKAVAVMANALRKVGYTLSDAFKKAWKFVKRIINDVPVNQ